MKVRWLGWAGVEIEARGARVVVDLLGDASGTLKGLGDRAGSVPLPELAPARPGKSVAGLVTHLHRDHTDAGALATALAPGAPVLHPTPAGGDAHENLWLAQAEAELAEAQLACHAVETWETRTVGPFTVTALPAVDGIGDPQVSWLIVADGLRILHLGDSMFHGYWWRISHRYGPFDLAFVPINGASVCFPHCEPPSPEPAVLDPAHAALAGHLLRASAVVPMHYGGFEISSYYEQDPEALEHFAKAASQYDYDYMVLQPGQPHIL